jgi:hypothetical protein
MFQDVGGQLWFLIDVLFVAALAGAILYGFIQWRRARPADDERAEQGTRDLYREEEAEEERRDADRAMRS